MKDAAPAISPISYPSRVAPLPEDRPAAEDEAGAEDALRTEAQRIELDAARTRSIFGMPVEEEELPYPTLIPVEKRQQKVAIDLVDAIRLVKVCCAPDLSALSTHLLLNNVILIVDTQKNTCSLLFSILFDPEFPKKL